MSGAAAWLWRQVAAALCPGWRWLAAIVGGGLLYEATVAIGSGHGRLAAWQGPVGVACGALAFGALWLATRDAPPARIVGWWRGVPGFARWPIWRAVVVLYLLWVPWHSFAIELRDAAIGHYHNDAIAYVHLDADLARQGINPYTDDGAFWLAALRWPLTGATPLLGGATFGSDPLAYPSTAAQSAALRADLASRQAHGAFDPQTAHNYPAGIIWLALPLVWAGLPSVIWLNLIALAGLAALLVTRAPPEQRLSALVALAACPVLWLYTLLENFDVACVVFVVAAWALWRRPRWSALALGVACAVKQLAWFFVPFYLVVVARREGWRAALARAGWLALAFVALNLPFIVASPVAWARGLFVPLADPLFPIGYGLVSLGLSSVAPLITSHVWTALELVVMLGLLAWQWRRRDPTPADALLLALVPLWFAWRSPMNYFAFLPALALWVVASRLAQPRPSG